MPTAKYEVRITASGTVRDADGNVVARVPIEQSVVLTEDELRAQITPSQEQP